MTVTRHLTRNQNQGAPPWQPRLIECHDCAQRYVLGDVPPGNIAKCRRCGSVLRRAPKDSLERTLAMSVGGLMLVLLANIMPFMSMEIGGRITHANLITGAWALWQQGMWPLTLIVAACTIIAPLAKLGAITYVLLALRLPRPPRHLPLLFRHMKALHPWSMIEVYLLGVFVAYVKLVDLAAIGLGVAFWSLIILMLVMVVIDVVMDDEAVWRGMERRGLVSVPPVPPGANLVACEICRLVAPMDGHHGACPRCGAGRHVRKPDSIARTWALLITATILYVPANVYPVMTVVSFGSGTSDTILSGVMELAAHGMWPLALLVFFASVTVPVAKIGGIILLLVTTQRNSRWRLRDRTVLYRIVETVGRWSMIDIFMISILVGLVQLGALATINTGVGAISFAAVVIITMIGATAFDPRLMWDAAEQRR